MNYESYKLNVDDFSETDSRVEAGPAYCQCTKTGKYFRVGKWKAGTKDRSGADVGGKPACMGPIASSVKVVQESVAKGKEYQGADGGYVGCVGGSPYAGDYYFDPVSGLLPMLKWAYEYDKKTVAGAQPVQIVHYCADYSNSNVSVIDRLMNNFNTSKNSYYALKCDCKPADDAKYGANAGTLSKCDHTDAGYGMKNGPNRNLFAILFSAKTASPSEIVAKLPEEYITNSVKKCVFETKSGILSLAKC